MGEKKVSYLRIRYPELPLFYDDKGNIYKCSCGNIADMVSAKPSKFPIHQTHADCYDCMRPLSQ